tara:strand:+ start:212 stop:568 length:357 start_codon:yes stop_codon:yes gene_type:complete
MKDMSLEAEELMERKVLNMLKKIFAPHHISQELRILKSAIGYSSVVIKNDYISHVSDWVSGAVDAPKDGDYLCEIEVIEECGEVYQRQRVVSNEINQWMIGDNEKVIYWRRLVGSPCR